MDYKDILLSIGALFIASKLALKYYWPAAKVTPFDPKNGIIYLCDQNVDHLTSLKDFITPQADAFDKPFELCNNISQIDENTHIKIVIFTKGGALTSCEKILKCLKAHKAGYTAYIKHESFSAGALIALGAKEIVMKANSYLGKIDPQIAMGSGGSIFPAVLYNDLDDKYITDHTIMNVKLSQSYINYTKILLEIACPKTDENKEIISNIQKQMIFSDFPHSKTFNITECKEMGLNIREPIDSELFLFN
jgi:hypothetical protein